MPTLDYPIENIHLPIHRRSDAIMQIIALTGGILAFGSGVLILIGALLQLPLLIHIFGKNLVNVPAAMAILVSSAAIVLYKIKKDLPLFLSGILLFIIGGLWILKTIFPQINMFLIFPTTNVQIGIFFLLFGGSAILSTLKIPHRFHVAQAILFPALLFSAFELINDSYQFILSGKIPHGLHQTTILGSLVFLLLCQSLMLIKPNRGFITLFNTETTSSLLARLTLMYFISVPPVLGLAVLIGGKLGFFTVNEKIAVLVVSMTAVSMMITWINVKLLYPAEVQYYLTKEAFRVNNLTLKLDTEDLSTKVNQLEKTKQEITGKLDHQHKLLDAVDLES